MKLGAMQPYFFPYIGYFQLMNLTDQWIIFDDIQFVNKGWINRNRILHPNPKKKWQYFTIPLSGKNRFDKISKIQVDNKQNWRDSIYGKLSHYKRRAPYYKNTMEFVRFSLNIEEDNLSKIVAHTITSVASLLSIKTTINQFSDLNLSNLKIENAGQWALEISKHVGATEYLNPINGRHLFNSCEFQNENINLKFLKRMVQYSQRSEFFIPQLSIIDIMMWDSIESIKEMLKLGVVRL